MYIDNIWSVTWQESVCTWISGLLHGRKMCAPDHRTPDAQDPNTKRFKQTRIYFDTDTQYANFGEIPFVKPQTTDKWSQMMKKKRKRLTLCWSNFYSLFGDIVVFLNAHCYLFFPSSVPAVGVQCPAPVQQHEGEVRSLGPHRRAGVDPRPHHRWVRCLPACLVSAAASSSLNAGHFQHCAQKAAVEPPCFSQSAAVLMANRGVRNIKEVQRSNTF